MVPAETVRGMDQALSNLHRGGWFLPDRFGHSFCSHQGLTRQVGFGAGFTPQPLLDSYFALSNTAVGAIPFPFHAEQAVSASFFQDLSYTFCFDFHGSVRLIMLRPPAVDANVGLNQSSLDFPRQGISELEI